LKEGDMVALPESAASGSISHLPLKDFTKANNRDLATTNTVSNYNGSSKDSPKEVNEKE
jgi:hypothetical protein